MKGKMPRTKYPKLRAWAKPTRKIMTMVIPSKKEKLGTRPARKKQLKKELKNHGV